MKDFFKYVAATMVGLLLFGIVMGMFAMMSLVGMVASGEATQSVKDNSVLVLNLSGTLEEQAQENPFAQFVGNGMNSMGLAETLTAIRKARDNDRVKGIYIETGILSADYASLQEIRNALADFRKSGKWIVAYGDAYTQGAYYLASVADKIYLNPCGEVDLHGIGAQPVFVKDLLEKVGIKMQVIKVGKYKSATEMFTEDKMSDANREQTEAYINGIWNVVCKDVSASRGISVEKINAYADSMVLFVDQKELVKMKLVDGLLYHDQIKAEIKKRLDLDEDDAINQMSIAEMCSATEDQSGEQIAVYYAFGDIVDAPAEGIAMGGGHQIVANKVIKDLEKLMKDDDVKAVVIRVNSGGGSAYASEQLWHAIEQLKAKKPVVVSMGGYAASGGYYMSCGAQWIVAEPTTLTGSIGIFGTIPDPSQLLTQKLGLKFDEVKTNKHALFGTQARPMNADETALMQRYIERGYALFLSRVAKGRKMTNEQVDALAQGHVYTGADALKIKLVDQLGGLDKAVTKAAQLAKLDKYHTCAYPAEPSLLEQLMQQANNDNYIDEQLRMSLGIYYEPFALLRTVNQMDHMQARLPFILNIR